MECSSSTARPHCEELRTQIFHCPVSARAGVATYKDIIFYHWICLELFYSFRSHEARIEGAIHTEIGLQEFLNLATHFTIGPGFGVHVPEFSGTCLQCNKLDHTHS